MDLCDVDLFRDNIQFAIGIKNFAVDLEQQLWIGKNNLVYYLGGSL